MLTINNLTKTYPGGKVAVDSLSLHVAPGEIYGFIGHNGAGKTTAIRAVVGVMQFDSGEIYINGHSVKEEPVLCKSITAYLPDNPDLYEYLRGIQYLNFIADMFQMPQAERMTRIPDIAGELGLLDNLGDLIGSYSHGMKQKLALISAFLHEPKLLVLDEPFVGLDPEASYRLKEMMRKLCEKGSAIFFSTHVLEVAEKLCNKIAIIKEGKLVASGDTDVVRGDSSLETAFLEVMDHDA